MHRREFIERSASGVLGLAVGAQVLALSDNARGGISVAEQEDWKNVLKADPTNWLLGDENPVIRHWTLRDLIGAPEEQIEAARQQALKSEVVQEVFRQQKPEGHWENPDNMHAPHYTSTVYHLTLLGDLGPTADDERIVKGVEAVLKTQRDDGGFPGHNPGACEYGPYDIGLIVRFMRQFGLGDDPRVARMCDWIEKNQTPEGGWVGVKVQCNPTPGGCLNGTANVLWGLATAGKFVGAKVAQKGIEFLTKVMASDPDYGRQLSYPQFWNFWIDDIKLAEICLKLGVSAEEEPLKEDLQNILALQEDDGRWLERQGPYSGDHQNCQRMRKLFPKKGEPSKWVTAKAMIVLKQALTG
jgi:hypothetical protein